MFAWTVNLKWSGSQITNRHNFPSRLPSKVWNAQLSAVGYILLHPLFDPSDIKEGICKILNDPTLIIWIHFCQMVCTFKYCIQPTSPSSLLVSGFTPSCMLSIDIDKTELTLTRSRSKIKQSYSNILINSHFLNPCSALKHKKKTVDDNFIFNWTQLSLRYNLIKIVVN